jgi:regulator of replication initiation timing
MNDRMDFEQQIVKCWSVVEDLKELSAHIVEHDLVGTDTVHNHIFGLACVYDVKFHNLWEMFESVHMSLVRENKMLNEECAALREQLAEAEGRPTLFGVDADGFEIKPNKKVKK